MGFPRQAYWSGLPFPSSGYLLDPRIEPESLPALAGRFFTTEPPGKPRLENILGQIWRKLVDSLKDLDYISIGSSGEPWKVFEEWQEGKHED